MCLYGTIRTTKEVITMYSVYIFNADGERIRIERSFETQKAAIRQAKYWLKQHFVDAAEVRFASNLVWNG